MDVLGRMFQSGMGRRLTSGLVAVNDLVEVSHLQFANDTFLFLLKNMVNFLKCSFFASEFCKYFWFVYQSW